MTHNYTPNMLVKLIYGETDLFETLEVENAIENNQELKAMYLNLKNGFQKFPKVKFAPSKASLENILFYSKLNTVDAEV